MVSNIILPGTLLNKSSKSQGCGYGWEGSDFLEDSLATYNQRLKRLGNQDADFRCCAAVGGPHPDLPWGF